MLRNIGRIILIGGLLIFILFVIWRCVGDRLGGGAETAPGMPNLQQIIPASWQVLSNRGLTCDFDLDGQNEWLVIYRYDQITDTTLATSFSPIGGFVYDAEVNRVPQEPGVQKPYRPAFLIPFKLLPDTYVGKGQGYLGETDVQVFVQPTGAASSNAGTGQQGGTSTPTCRSEEINILGYSGNPYTAGDPPPTRLSIFRWMGEPIGYAGVSFVGNARVLVTPNVSSAVTKVVTYNGLNDRSVLCAVQTFDRQVDSSAAPVLSPPTFAEQANLYTIDFCYGAPPDPAYPEGVVLALLRGRNPNDGGSNPTPTGNSYFTPNASVPPELGALRDALRDPYPVLSVTYPGALVTSPGYRCDESAAPLPQTGSGINTPAAAIWWCGDQQTEVVTDLLLDGQPRQATWTLVSMASDRATAGVFWRVSKVEVR